MKLLILFFLLYSTVSSLIANKYDCIIASKKYEKKFEIPENLLLSISLTESGKKVDSGEFVSWPWTINRKGKGKFFNNKESAIKFVYQYTEKGKKNIDLGCMQVNFMYHPNAFSNFEEAFDPDKNVEWAAKKLRSLYLKFGSWKSAVGYYHSYRNTKRKKYSAKVFKTLLSVQNKNNFDFIKIAALVDDKKDLEIEQKKKYEPLMLVKDKINTHLNKEKYTKEIPTHSEYILARMEKVRFFRNYFNNTIKKN